MRVVLTGGGTGGHVIPNVEIIEELRKQKSPKGGPVEILYLGSRRGPEKKIVKDMGINYQQIAVGKLRRYFSWQNFIDVGLVLLGIFQALWRLFRFKADVIFSKGGYVSVPVLLAGFVLRVPIVIHESDVKPGLATKIGAMVAKKVCTSFHETKELIRHGLKNKVVYTGTPLREELKHGDKEKGLKLVGLNKFRPVILVMGGSQGAAQINKLVRENLDELLKKFQIVHVTGKGKLDIGVKRRGYVQFEYLGKELADVYAAADMVISRGGANSLFEIGMLKKKALIIPLGHATRGEQAINAKVFAKNFGWSVLEGNIGNEQFVEAVNFTFKNSLGSANVQNGAKAITKVILNTAKW